VPLAVIAGAPDPVAPFSHAVEADGWVFVTGQMPFPGTSLDAPYPEGIEARAHASRLISWRDAAPHRLRLSPHLTWALPGATVPLLVQLRGT